MMFVICNDDGGGKEKMRSSGGRSFQRRGVIPKTRRQFATRKRMAKTTILKIDMN